MNFLGFSKCHVFSKINNKQKRQDNKLVFCYESWQRFVSGVIRDECFPLEQILGLSDISRKEQLRENVEMWTVS